MDVDRWRRVEAVLDVALTHEPAQWSEVLDDACSGDPDLRREVEALLERLNTAHSFLESPPAAAAAALLAEARETAMGAEQPLDKRIGAYRLVREIGRGGMSRVYLAERADGQFEQRVALKVLRPGLDSDLDLGRFRAERQILASLNHANIARLLDGGVTDDGLPYLVMELVDGEPLDRYAKARTLTIDQRLALFLTVVETTQYAHRNLVVHRDLKPSNILVTSDGVVKLLDFGLAKMLGPAYPSAPAPTTQAGHHWMTPEYAAPEQIRGEPVTTLTDVYQLGTVLYELLSGRLPFGTVGTSAHELGTAVLERDPESLGGALAGDIDAIVAKAMCKRPDDRYASAQALGDDIRRHLSGFPVLARRPTAGYVARRFVRRHRVGLAAASVIGLLLTTYVATVAVDRARIARALTEATAGTRKAEQTTDFVLGLFEAAEGGKALTDTVTARELLTRGVAQARELSAQPDLQAQMLDVIGRVHTQLGDYDQALPLLDEALAIRRRIHGENHPDVATSLDNLADVAAQKAELPRTIALRREALAVRRRLAGDRDQKSITALYELASALHTARQSDEANRLFDEWFALIARQPPEMSAVRADQLYAGADFLAEKRRLPEAEAMYRQALAIRRTVFGPKHHLVAMTLVEIATTFRMDTARMQEADSLLREAVEVLRTVYPTGHPTLAFALRFHGQMQTRLGRPEDAIQPLREAIAMWRESVGADGLPVANTESDLTLALNRLGQFQEAERVGRDAMRIDAKLLGERSAMVYQAQTYVGGALIGQKRFAEAESLLVGAYVRFEHPNLVTAAWRRDALLGLVRLYDAEHKPAEAARYGALLAEPVSTASPTAHR